MGSCLSVHKDPESTLKFRVSFRSRNDKSLIPSPLKERSEIINGLDSTVAFKSKWSPARPVNKVRDHDGSKDAIFFDSQPWLDSDCEEDFLSVNGDFTPSRGSTPVHHSFSVGSPQVNKAPVVEENSLFPKPKPEPEPEVEPEPELSPTDKRKRLSELFKESLRVEQYPDGNSTSGDDHSKTEEAEANSHVPQAKSKIGNPTPTPTPYLSGADSVSYCERVPNGTVDKSAKMVQCCLPRLLSSHNFSEKNKKMGPVLTVG